MAFNLTRWQTDVRAWWTEHGPRIKSAPIKSAYTLLTASAWLPFLAAYGDDPGPATCNSCVGDAGSLCRVETCRFLY